MPGYSGLGRLGGKREPSMLTEATDPMFLVNYNILGELGLRATRTLKVRSGDSELPPPQSSAMAASKKHVGGHITPLQFFRL
jgi:hypothetical protein